MVFGKNNRTIYQVRCENKVQNAMETLKIGLLSNVSATKMTKDATVDCGRVPSHAGTSHSCTEIPRKRRKKKAEKAV
jgi:hypothetical protein